MTKRLFIFAAYDKDGIVDPTLMHYLTALSKMGDIVFIMDNDASDTELAKVHEIPNVLYASAVRHGEYDFGSYKRGYMWAYDNKILNKYDWVYLVNDSVYGPICDLEPIVIDLESRGTDVVCMSEFASAQNPVHAQSWFVGLSCQVATSNFFKEFLFGVCSQPEKHLIIYKYEVRMSQLILQHGYNISSFIGVQNGDICHELLEQPLVALNKGLPFIKKLSVNANVIKYLYQYTNDQLVDYMCANAMRTSQTFTAPPPKYTKVVLLRFLGIPVFSIYNKSDYSSKSLHYKLYLFDVIPVFKFFIKKF